MCPHLEHHRVKQVAHRLVNIYLDAADDLHLDARDGHDQALQVVFYYVVCRIGQSHLGLLRRFDLREVGLQCFAHERKLIIVSAGACGNRNRRRLVRLRLPLVVSEPRECSHSGATSRVVRVLPLALELPEFAVWGDTDVRRELDDQVSASGHVLGEGVVAEAANEGDPGETTHVKGALGDAAKAVVKAIGVVVDFVGAHAAGEEGVIAATPLLEQGEVDSLVGLHGEGCPGKVLEDPEHGGLFDGWVIRDLQLPACVNFLC